MDATDLSILNLLKENAKTTVSQISKKVNLSIPAVAERIRKLNEANVVERYTIQINRKMMGYSLMAFVFVNIDTSAHIEQFRDAVIQFPQVIECHHMAGEYDYLLKVLMTDTCELEDFLSSRLKALKGVEKSNTLIVLSTLKELPNR
ncbi:MAG: Lrp/AsnC family transcriptional regulator [Acetanaerobacterium sp.]